MITTQRPTEVSIITTYRCQMRCQMCDIWRNPSSAAKEITPQELDLLPHFKFVNLTGGEPFLRDDLEEIVAVMSRKAQRILISTSGWHEQRILKLAEKFPNIGIRVSIEGLAETNDKLRGRQGGFARGYRLLQTLLQMGVKDVGFGITLSDANYKDLLPLYALSRELNVEFTTAASHNSFYFHKSDTQIVQKQAVAAEIERLINALLKENRPKSWFRAFFNLGLINYINGGRRMLPCEAGNTNFILEPYGDVYCCTGLENRIWKQSMGNIRKVETFDELWFSERAQRVRTRVYSCPKNCWMVGTAAPVMKKYLRHPAGWVFKNKLRSLRGLPVRLDDIPWYKVGQDPEQGDLDFTRLQPFDDGTGVKPDQSLPLIGGDKDETKP